MLGNPDRLKVDLASTVIEYAHSVWIVVCVRSGALLVRPMKSNFIKSETLSVSLMSIRLGVHSPIWISSFEG